MQRIALALTLALLATLTSPARAGDVYPDGIGDFADATLKSLADWHAIYGDCDPAKPPTHGSVCAPASSALACLSRIDAICTSHDPDGVCVAASQLDGSYGDTSPSEPLAVSCQRDSASCVIEGGSSTLRRRSVTTCGAWGRCACWDPDDFFPSRERQCCTTTSWDGVPGSVTICVREVASCGGGPETECW